jgi:serine/threonine-protein kinase
MSQVPHLPEAGDVVAGRYRVDEQLGRGGMGAVFRATQLGLMRAVALKVLLPERTGATVRERFEREARVAAAMRHDGVVDVYDFGVDDDGRMFIVMELLIGESLRARLDRQNTLSFEEATQVMLQVGAALGAAHDVGLVHRDIKPDNIFCVEGNEGPRFKVVDFGLAFIKDGGDLGRLTSDTIISGTPAIWPQSNVAAAPTWALLPTSTPWGVSPWRCSRGSHRFRDSKASSSRSSCTSRRRAWPRVEQTHRQSSRC